MDATCFPLLKLSENEHGCSILNSLALGFDMSDRNDRNAPSPQMGAENRSAGVFERLGAILQVAQTGKSAGSAEPQKIPQPRALPALPAHIAANENITHTLPAPQRTAERIEAERSAIARTVALQQATEQLTRVNGYLVERGDMEAYAWLREETKRVRGEYEAAKIISDVLCGPAWQVTYYDGDTRDTDSDSIQTDAGKRDEEDYETRKKRPHCPKCGASGNSLTRRDGKSNRVLRSAWQCMACGEEFDKADWKKPFFKSDADVATEKLEANRAAIRADFLAGQTCLHALTYLFEPHTRGCESTMDDLDAMGILLQANQSCLQAFEYRNLDDALVEDIRKIRIRYVMGVAEAIQQRKRKYTPKGALITAPGYGIKAPANAVPIAVRRIRAVVAAEPYPRRKPK